MKTSYTIISFILFVAPIPIWIFGKYLPYCTYGFVHPLLNYLPTKLELEAMSVYASLIGYLLLLWGICRGPKKRAWYFKFFQAFLLSILMVFLVSVFLASQNVLRNKGPQAATKAFIASMQAYAEIYADNNGQSQYLGFCTSDEMLRRKEELRMYGYDPKYCIISTDDLVQCVDSINGYAMTGKIISKGNVSYFCADSTQFSGIVASPTNDTTCR